MAYAPPTVLEDVDLPDFVRYVLDAHDEPSTLVVCGTKDAFLEDLKVAATHGRDESDLQGTQQQLQEDRTVPRRQVSHSAQQLWTLPTLRSLATSRTVKVAFCPDITHLRAYFATYVRPDPRSTSLSPTEGGNATRILAVLNPIQLHRPTSAFSAQGLNRTFSAAVEAAYRTQSQLLIAECPTSSPNLAAEDVPAHDVDELPPAERRATEILWDEEVSILNVTTKSFGAGERGWVGRTVKLRTVAERWCHFEAMSREPEAG